MATFTDKQQELHRQSFIEDCRQKAWGAACNADFVAKRHKKILSDYEALATQDADLKAQIKSLDTAIDFHTKDNREKRKGLQERRNLLAKQKEALQRGALQLQEGLQGLYGAVETNLALAKHAETWEWKEAKSTEKQ